MDYTLVKQLKDAGFPILSRMDALAYEQDLMSLLIPPTLSELIEACGRDFGVLLRGLDLRTIPDGVYYKAYRSAKILSTEPAHSIANFLISPMGEGAIPEEAVAKLWLAINKPQ